MMLLGTFCAATAFYAARAGGQVARLCTVSALGLALLLMLLLALRRGIALSRAANTEVATDTPHHPAGMVWETFRRGFPGAIIAPAIGD